MRGAAVPGRHPRSAGVRQDHHFGRDHPAAVHQGAEGVVRGPVKRGSGQHRHNAARLQVHPSSLLEQESVLFKVLTFFLCKPAGRNQLKLVSRFNSK